MDQGLNRQVKWDCSSWLPWRWMLFQAKQPMRGARFVTQRAMWHSGCLSAVRKETRSHHWRRNRQHHFFFLLFSICNYDHCVRLTKVYVLNVNVKCIKYIRGQIAIVIVYLTVTTRKERHLMEHSENTSIDIGNFNSEVIFRWYKMTHL